MHLGIWLTYAVILGPALSATVSNTSQIEDSLAASRLKLILPGNLSAATTNNLSAQTASISNEVPFPKLLLLNDTSPSLSKFPASLYDLPFGYELPREINAVPRCNGTVYGTNLDRNSCFDAWQNVGWMPERVSWGPRGTSHSFQYRLPYRWSSSEYGIRSDVCNDRS